MRGEGEAVAGRVGLHEAEVVVEALGGEGEDRGGEAAGEEVAALGRQLGDGEAVRVRGAPETVVDAFPGEPGERFGTGVADHGASLSWTVAILATFIAYIAYRCLTSRPTPGQRSRRHPVHRRGAIAIVTADGQSTAALDVVDVVALGESMVTFLPGRPGRLADVPSFDRAIGGAESNAACVLAAAGHTVRWVSRVGADGFGDHLVETIGGYGVDVSAVRRDPERPTGIYFRTAGDRATDAHEVAYYRAGSAASAMTRGTSTWTPYGPGGCCTCPGSPRCCPTAASAWSVS